MDAEELRAMDSVDLGSITDDFDADLSFDSLSGPAAQPEARTHAAGRPLHVCRTPAVKMPAVGRLHRSTCTRCRYGQLLRSQASLEAGRMRASATRSIRQRITAAGFEKHHCALRAINRFGHKGGLPAAPWSVPAPDPEAAKRCPSVAACGDSGPTHQR